MPPSCPLAEAADNALSDISDPSVEQR
jgi:hypothetical protein